MSDRLKGRSARTEKLIEYFRGNADEFAMLKGVLCVAHVMEGQDLTRWRYFFDTLRIAERMDEIRRAASDTNLYPFRRAVRIHGRRKDDTNPCLRENTMYRMTLREQEDVLARIAATAPYDSTRSAAIEAARGNRATALQVLEIRRALQRWADLGNGNARDEARRALAQTGDDGQGVRWYETGEGKP